ncbi:MAG: hypothetical protein CMG13_00110 [Candidatus Marinimicrobia bacterium]|nr:hypothetical protein [Candidatus Neomarinimicrobiota bacterium]
MKYRFDINNYEFNSSSKLGVYLIHGFSSTTYEVKELAEFLSNNGYYTIAKNLPGHGTTVEECNRARFTDWLNQVKKDIAELSVKCEKVFVIGGSMGGVISLYMASLFPLNAYVVGGTVLNFKNPFETNFLVPLLCNFIKIQPKKKQLKANNVKFYGYKAYPLIALNEFRKMIKIVKPLLPKIKTPGLIIHSNNDQMSLKNNLDILEDSIQSQYFNKLIVEKAHHNMFDENPDQEIIFSNILNFLNKFKH